MRFLSMFSGIDAASAAWGPLGWKAAAFCEIEAFPSAVLAHHYPDVPNLGDVTKADFDGIGPVDLAVFGSPCQSFSVAGKRLGLDDARGNLALLAGGIVYRKRPRWFVFENVPGLLSSDGGWDFGTLIAAFAGYPSGSVFAPPEGGWGSAGVVAQANGQSYGIAWRVLDAQYFGLAQRRKRVFVVGYLGDWRRAAAVLFERHSLSGHPAPRREAGKAAPTIPSRSSGGGGLGTDFDCDGGLIAGEPTVLMERGRNGSPNLEYRQDGTANAILTPNGGRGGLGVGAIAFDTTQITSSGNYSSPKAGDPCHPLASGAHARAFPINTNALRGDTCAKTPSRDAAGVMRLRDPGLGVGDAGDPADTLQAAGPGAVAYAVRTNQTGQNGPGFMANLSPSLSSDESVPAVARTIEAMYGVSHADASQTGPYQALRTMFEAAGEEAATQWCLGVLAAFWPAEVLRPEVHGRGVRCSAIPQRGLVNVALSRSQTGAAWSVQDLWEAGRDGRAPQGWRPHQQRAGELGSYLSELPYSPSPAQRLLHDMWVASEGAGLLREALSALQEARQSACGEVQSAHAGSAVRRLTVEECEALQGFPRSYTLIPWRKGMASDGPRYKALGNSFAVPVVRWIGERIQNVEAACSSAKTAA